MSIFILIPLFIGWPGYALPVRADDLSSQPILNCSSNHFHFRFYRGQFSQYLHVESKKETDTIDLVLAKTEPGSDKHSPTFVSVMILNSETRVFIVADLIPEEESAVPSERYVGLLRLISPLGTMPFLPLEDHMPNSTEEGFFAFTESMICEAIHPLNFEMGP